MKKIFSFVLIVSMSFLLGCFENEYEENEGKITLSIASSYLEYMHYDNIPTFTFEYDGVINTLANNNYNYFTIFCMNDDLLLSNHLSKLFEHYEDDMMVVLEKVVEAKNAKVNVNVDGKRINKKINIDDNKKYYETCYIYLENGLQLCVSYCKFISDGTTYYRWQETKNIEMAIFYPLMLIEEDGKKEFVIVPLPFNIPTHISGSTKSLAKDYINDDSFVYTIDNSNYTYSYYDNSLSVIDYYTSYHNGTIDDGSIYFSYLNVSFRIDLFEDNFKIRYLGKTGL